MGRPRKEREEEVVEDLPEEVKVEGFLPKSELDVALARQAELLELRAKLVGEGIDSISKLDALLGQVNQQVKILS